MTQNHGPGSRRTRPRRTSASGAGKGSLAGLPDRTLAYFSMEIGLSADMPTYSGGLGVLAGDTIRAAADLRIPMVAVTLLHRKGYFQQKLDATGSQSELPVEWSVDEFLQKTDARTSIQVEERPVQVCAWRRDVQGTQGFSVPVYFLDSALEENAAEDRHLTDFLYGGDSRYRLAQEMILGLGGVRILRALGYQGIERFHMNEGHSSLLTVELLREERERGRRRPAASRVEAVRRRCVFTTHTPVPAGHDRFPPELAGSMLRELLTPEVRRLGFHEGRLNMTYLALNLSHYVNGVARKHGEVSRDMFAPHPVDSITNGVHAATWAAPALAKLFDRFLPTWRESSLGLRLALAIPPAELERAHREAKAALVEHANRETGAGLDLDVFTIGFARRMTAYKQPDLVFRDPARLRRIAATAGPLQMIFSGKAHPRDEQGKELIRQIFRFQKELGPEIRVVYLSNYDMDVGRLMTSGVDLWLNTPQPPLEASGTSGMKAALNGVPSLSILDGWWFEGCIEGVTGWSIQREDGTAADAPDGYVRALHDKLEHEILPLFHQQRERFVEVMRHAIAINGAFFNTHRMVQQYLVKAYR